MSVFYLTTNPMTLDEAVRRLNQIGCTVKPQDYSECCVVVKDRDDNYFHLNEAGGPTRVSAELFVDSVQPHTFDVATRVAGTSYLGNDASVMAAALNMVSEFDDEYDEISTGPMDCLWVRRRDGSLTSIDQTRLLALDHGEPVETEVEQLLVDDPDWLSTYVNDALGNHCVMISEGAPLPQWSPEWLERWSKRDETLRSPAEPPLPKLASGEIDHPTLKAQIAKKFHVEPGGYFICQGPGGAISIETAAEFVQREVKATIARLKEQGAEP